jgi:hypothetical protein
MNSLVLKMNPNMNVNGLINLNNGMEILKADLNFGLPKEDPVIQRLSEFFNETVEKETYQYSRFDASSKTTKYEIKSRRNKYLQYPTTIIPVDKTMGAIQHNEGRLVFVFNFTDGLYYIVFDKDVFSKYEIKPVSAFRAGGVKTLKDHFFIPVKDLIQITI